MWWLVGLVSCELNMGSKSRSYMLVLGVLTAHGLLCLKCDAGGFLLMLHSRNPFSTISNHQENNREIMEEGQR